LTKILLWLALIANPYSAEMDVIVVYPYAWADISYVSNSPSWVVYSDWRPPGEYDCIIARSYQNEGDAWEQARKNLKTSRCRKGEYGE
jgi:hypothetical protein